MKKTSLAMTLASAVALGACTDDEPKSQTSQSSRTYDPGNLISLDIPVTRKEVDFTVSVNAYCGAIDNTDDYAAACAAAATKAMQQKFLCSQFALAAVTTLSDNQAVIGAGLQGNYETFPVQYLYTQEELETDITNTSKRRRNAFIIKDISNIDAAADNYLDGGQSLPPSCTPD